MSRLLITACGVALATPVVGLVVLLLGWPSIDGRWEHQPSHFWIVIGAAVLKTRTEPMRIWRLDSLD